MALVLELHTIYWVIEMSILANWRRRLPACIEWVLVGLRRYVNKRLTLITDTTCNINNLKSNTICTTGFHESS